MTTAPAFDVETGTVRKLFWRLLPFLFLLYVVNYLDRINVGFAALQMRDQLGFGDRVFGTAFGIFFVGYFFFQLPSNLALAYVGARRWMAAIMVLWGVVSICMIFVRTPSGFYTMRFILGAAEAGFFPGVILYLKNWFPASARARAIASFMTANALAGVVGSPLSGALLGLNRLGLAGWQWMFVLEGLPAVFLAGVVLFTLKDDPEQAKWLAPEQKHWLIEGLTREREQHAAAVRGNLHAAVLSLTWRILLLIIVYFGITSSAYGIILWLPNYIHSLTALSNWAIGVVSLIPYFAAAVFMVLIGVRSDRTGDHRSHLAGTAFAAAVSLLIAAYTRSIVPGLAFVTLGLMTTLSMQGPFWAMATSLTSGIAVAATIAIINSFGNLGGFFGPYIIGLKRSAGGSFRGGMLVIAVLLAIAGTVSLLVRAPRRNASSVAHNPLQ